MERPVRGTRPPTFCPATPRARERGHPSMWLGQAKDPRAVEPLIATLKDEFGIVRAAAEGALPRSGLAGCWVRRNANPPFGPVLTSRIHRRRWKLPLQNPTRTVIISECFTGTITFVSLIANDREGTNLSHSIMSVSFAVRGLRVKLRTAFVVFHSVSYSRTMYSFVSSAFLTDSTVTLDGATSSTL